MAALFPLLPAFLDLAGRAVYLLQADAAAALLCRRLLDCGASVTFVDPAPSADVLALAPPARVLRRRWRASDFRNATLVVSDAKFRSAARARLAAKAAKALFLTLDASADSDFALGDSNAALGPVVFALSAGGAPDGLVAALSARLQAAAPPHLAGFFEAAVRMRADLPEDPVFWATALGDASAATGQSDWAAWLAARAKRFSSNAAS